MSDRPTTRAARADVPFILRGTGNLGVVLVHDITGLDAFNRSMAERLNREGFWVAAVDLFDGRTAAGLEDGMKLRAGLTKQRMADVLRDGLERLKAEMGPGAVIGAWGFCMGGGAALQGACTSPFAFCVDYYGRIDDAGEVRGLSGPLLLILGSEDDRLNPWVYGDLLPRLDEHRKRVHVDLYPGVAHAFHREGWPPYDKAAASEAWVHAVEFARNAGR